VKTIFQSTVITLLLGLAVFPTQAAFTSLYVFGDSLSATADPNAPRGQYFYGQRWSNGRVWAEVLAQRQGLTFDNTKNNSYYDHNSIALVTDIVGFQAPADVASALFVVWVCNADTFDAAQNHDSSVQWTAANNLSQVNHLQIITTLYTKGVRNLILPNAVDISKIPAYDQATSAKVMHDGCVAYNAAFANTINQARLLCPGLKIYTPDFFTLLNNVLTNSAAYGLTNALSSGFSIDAFSDASIANLTLNGQGNNYIFWDPQDPTAKLHEIMADVTQQIISPVKISKLAVLGGSNRLDVVNAPIGLDGFVVGSTNLAQGNWTAVTNGAFNSTSLTQSIFVVAPVLPSSTTVGGSGGSGGSPPPPDSTGSNTNSTSFKTYPQFYRLQFPYAWSWP
jgi:phospholipase/lecithinase/hemolysin